MPHVYFLSLLFFSMDHLLSQAYVASASHYDKYKAPTFFIQSYMALEATRKKAASGKDSVSLYKIWQVYELFYLYKLITYFI